MQTFIKSLFLTLLFFVYTFAIFETGAFLEKRAIEIKQAEEAALEEQQNIDRRTAEEYHKYYEIVVSRIKASELEGINKEALKTYIAGYDKRFEETADIFFPDREKPDNNYGSGFPVVFNAFKKAFDESEIAAYKNLILSTGMALSEEDTEYIFKEQPAPEPAAPVETEAFETETPNEEAAPGTQESEEPLP